MSPVRRGLSLVLVVICSCGVGCAKISERTHARYELGMPLKLRPANPGGLYRIKWSATADGNRRPLDGSTRLVRRGEIVGFMKDKDGQILAVAGESQFTLTDLPSEARHFVWSTEYPRDSYAPSARADADAGTGFFFYILEALLDSAFAGDDDDGRNGDDDGSRGKSKESSRGAVPWKSPPIK